ncbi:Spo0B C-terminal domain-containing protein [Pseudalkalibacillus berkeleyi]|uniref:Sporulation initiation phosphotransferase B n=1 Tax=Pseudalkalibacillus berkeleyi TaxID=1069813 RepID=A0ABS9H210_9BACL|nr:Spo0B C-terminal domain-containing protein [Pseudalkalibacillus berkeleyi]MCF6138086.1 sporulation initiation phosphotransferase B [Pseudalkalibacillus berkeleyi]
MKGKMDSVSLLRHARHDWLNQLQLIKGNLALDRTDRAKEIIDQVVQEAKNEAKVSNLKMPMLAELFLTYNWLQNQYRLDYEVIGTERDLSKYDQPLFEWTSCFLSEIEKHVVMDSEPHLMVTIQLFEDKVRISYDFAGVLDVQNIEQSMDSSQITVHNSIRIIESYSQENELLYILELG